MSTVYLLREEREVIKSIDDLREYLKDHFGINHTQEVFFDWLDDRLSPSEVWIDWSDGWHEATDYIDDWANELEEDDLLDLLDGEKVELNELQERLYDKCHQALLEGPEKLIRLDVFMKTVFGVFKVRCFDYDTYEIETVQHTEDYDCYSVFDVTVEDGILTVSIF